MTESLFIFFFQAEDGIRDLVRSRGLGDVYKRQQQQRPDLCIGAAATHHVVHHLAHLRALEIDVRNDSLQRLAYIHRSDQTHGLGSRDPEEIGQQIMTMLGQDRFGMKLYPLDRQFAVAHTHDLVDAAAIVLGPRGDFQAVRQAALLDHQRVIAGGLEGIREAAEHTLVTMVYLRGLAMHDAPGTHDPPAKRCLLYTSDAADERSSVDLVGRRIIKKKTQQNI